MKILFLTNNKVSFPLAEWLQNQHNEVFISSEKLCLKYLDIIQPELVVSYNYRYIIKAEEISLADNKIVNLHISYLPYNRGAYPNLWSILDNTPKGITIHFVNKELDKGKIIARKEIKISDACTLNDSYRILHEEIQSLFKEIYPAYNEWANMSFTPAEVGSYHSVNDFNRINHLITSWEMTIKDLICEYSEYQRRQYAENLHQD
jgi:methionyl-tRNA formyltransferase